MKAADFHQTLDIWIEGLEPYDFDRLVIQPTPGSWSLGQVYMHLLTETDFFFKQIHICASTDEHAEDGKNQEGYEMFANNAFPDEIIEGPPSNALVTQPPSREHIVERLAMLKYRIDETARLISQSQFKGKTKHPGLDYLNAGEWFQFAEMHIRHHLRQKGRIEAFLKSY